MNERLGTELSAAARQVIADARGGDDPTAEDEARVKARWLAGIAAGAGVSSLSEAVRAAASTGWGLKAGALIAALAAASAGVYLGWPQLSESKHGAPTSSAGRQPASGPVASSPGTSSPGASGPVASGQAPVVAAPDPALRVPAAPVPPAELSPPAPEQPTPEPTQTVPELPSAPAPALAAAPAPALAAAPAPALAAAPAPALAAAPALPPEKLQGKAPPARTSTPARSVSARRTPPERAPAEAAAPAPSGQLGEEIALLSEIRSNLQSGAAARALEQLAAYRQRFGQPNLAMEADALQVDALCRAGQHEAARSAAQAFSSRWPGSPLQQRVSAACP